VEGISNLETPQLPSGHPRSRSKFRGSPSQRKSHWNLLISSARESWGHRQKCTGPCRSHRAWKCQWYPSWPSRSKSSTHRILWCTSTRLWTCPRMNFPVLDIQHSTKWQERPVNYFFHSGCDWIMTQGLLPWLSTSLFASFLSSLSSYLLAFDGYDSWYNEYQFRGRGEIVVWGPCSSCWCPPVRGRFLTWWLPASCRKIHWRQSYFLQGTCRKSTKLLPSTSLFPSKPPCIFLCSWRVELSRRWRILLDSWNGSKTPLSFGQLLFELPGGRCIEIEDCRPCPFERNCPSST